MRTYCAPCPGNMKTTSRFDVLDLRLMKRGAFALVSVSAASAKSSTTTADR